MKTPKGVVRPSRHKVTIELTDVQAEALECLAKRLFCNGPWRRALNDAEEQFRLSRAAETLAVVAMSDLNHWLDVSDKIVDYCKREGLDGRYQRAAVYDDRVAAGFRAARIRLGATGLKGGAR